ncbi:hypothetical protein HN385_04570 [archaeon]|jgi:hypothetical protein|nr:hypothetical protein [archaeon]MBT3450436.1 hypothetical protein [archaeon]MBT6868505.1 hypothetical protein [archaeon]MBT7192766.1 hypothetical protein [archaeon]
MSELTLLHFSDTHNWDKLEVIANFVEKQKVDATLWTGDTFNFDTRNKEGIGAKLHEAYFKHTDSTELNKLINDYVQTYSQLEEKQKQGKLTQEDVDSFQTKRMTVQVMLDSTSNGKKAEIETDLRAIIDKESQKAKEHFAKIAKHCPIYGVLGNHDLNTLYNSLKDEVKFLEQTDKEIIKSKGGLEFILKGDNNTFEVPVAMSGMFGVPGIELKILENLLNPLKINYNSGHTLNGIDQQLRQYAQAGETEKVKELTQEKEKLSKYQEAERKRLGSIDENIDIYLTHKTPHCGTVRKVGGPLGDIAEEYGNKANLVCGGHMHDGQAGKSNLTKVVDYFKSDNTNKIKEGEEEIAVYKMERGEMQEFNPGGEHFFVYSYDSNKQVEHVDVYEFTYDVTV